MIAAYSRGNCQYNVQVTRKKHRILLFPLSPRRSVCLHEDLSVSAKICLSPRRWRSSGWCRRRWSRTRSRVRPSSKPSSRRTATRGTTLAIFASLLAPIAWALIASGGTLQAVGSGMKPGWARRSRRSAFKEMALTSLSCSSASWTTDGGLPKRSSLQTWGERSFGACSMALSRFSAHVTTCGGVRSFHPYLLHQMGRASPCCKRRLWHRQQCCRTMALVQSSTHLSAPSARSRQPVSFIR